jgi:predicted short-subunit dehydrogenase-like oxidoreductase (DUF2520 family)
MISIVLIGAGNVASHLYKAFSTSELVTVKQWYNRSIDAIKTFENNVAVTDNLNTLVEADVYIISVSDDAAAGLSQKLPFANRLVVHTSGSLGLHEMDKKNTRGVFYPLQSFSKNAEMDFKNVPICVECEERKYVPLLKKLGMAIDSPVHKVNSDQRQVLHLSAVFVNNFTNQLYRIAHEIAESQHAEFDILKPLILETAKKIEYLSPYLAQTGPAKRNDIKTIKRHLRQLENKQHVALYKLMTASIQKTHGIPDTKKYGVKSANEIKKKTNL